MFAPGVAIPSKSRSKSFAKLTNTWHDQSSDKVVSETAKNLVDEVSLLLQNGASGEEAVGTCVICIGSTGTGKSSTISKCTGRDVPSGSGKDRVTIRCDMYKRKNCESPNEPIWVDTVGWDDADLRDDNTFKDILRFIGENHLLCVKAIIWTVLPNVRKDATLTKQAKMINMFKERDIWRNVIIICKQSRNPEEDCQGAIAAARAFNTTVTIPVLGYTYLNDATFTRRQREKFEDKIIREDFNVRTDEEVSNMIFSTIDSLGPAIQVVFRNQKCLSCSEVGDARLMSRYCHMEKVSLHPGTIMQFHPGLVERFHDSATVLKEHTEGLYRPWYSCDFLFCNLGGGDRYLCCKALSGQPGCTEIQ